MKNKFKIILSIKEIIRVVIVLMIKHNLLNNNILINKIKIKIMVTKNNFN